MYVFVTRSIGPHRGPNMMPSDHMQSAVIDDDDVDDDVLGPGPLPLHYGTKK